MRAPWPSGTSSDRALPLAVCPCHHAAQAAPAQSYHSDPGPPPKFHREWGILANYHEEAPVLLSFPHSPESLHNRGRFNLEEFP